MSDACRDNERVRRPKVLVVILNKDNAEGLKETLASLVAQDGDCSICRCFDVLVMDGDSKDRSREYVKWFASKYPCIEFKIQEFKGGVGPARIEAVKYALERGYDYLIWGDSENIYLRNYIAAMLSIASECDVVSGKPVLKCDDVFSKLFYWYHSYHVLFSYVRKVHAPGNNKLVKALTYLKSIYPPIVRSDDFYFSIVALKRGVRYCYNDKALVEVKVPSDWDGIKSWQRMRVLGLVQGAKLLGMRLPPDFMLWSLLALCPAYSLLATYLALTPRTSYVGLTLLALIALVWIFLYIKLYILSKDVCLKHRSINALLGLLGMYLHSIFTTYYTILFTIKYMKEEVRAKLFRYYDEVDTRYGISAILKAVD